MKLRIVSWNVNGIRAAITKGLYDILPAFNADIICLQETKADEKIIKDIAPEMDGYVFYASSADKKGYSGTAVFSKQEPLKYIMNTGNDEYDREGRIIALEYPEFYLINLYVPNSGQELKRLDFRKGWDLYMPEYIKKITEGKPVIITGDMNVANEPKDLARPGPNYNKTAGYTQVEIDGFRSFLSKGYTDTFRLLYPDKIQYTFWNQRFNARAKGIGWRIDYFLVSNDLTGKVKDSTILDEVPGSDHCPVALEIDF
jgi:exodeoxyribonuclease III